MLSFDFLITSNKMQPSLC